MRLFSKGGVPPCDRSLDRRKVAIAAVAALFLFATATAKAGVVDFVISPASKITVGQSFDLRNLGLGIHFTKAGGQLGTGDTSTLSGSLHIDYDPVGGTMQMVSGGFINYAKTGAYVPFDPVTSDPVGLPPAYAGAGVTPSANFGTMTAQGALDAVKLFAVIYNLSSDLATGPVAPLSLVSTGTFDLSGNAIINTAGRLASVSTFGNDTGDIIGDPLAFMSTAGVGPGAGMPPGGEPPGNPPGPGTVDTGDLGIWDGTTLTIPITSFFTLPSVVATPGGPKLVNINFFATGTIIATPKVPEPSTMMLLGFGVVGLLTCGWRLKSKKALVS